MLNHKMQFFERLLENDMPGSLAVIEHAIAEGSPPGHILQTVVGAAMERVGKMQAFKVLTLSEVYMTAMISDAAIERLLKEMPVPPEPIGCIVIGSAEGDYHSLGRKIVSSFLRAASFQIIDLGVSVSATTFVDRAVQENARIIAVSALLLHTAERIIEIRKLLDERQLQQIKLIVGGAAFNFDSELVKRVGADAMAPNAMGAVTTVQSLLGAYL